MSPSLRVLLVGRSPLRQAVKSALWTLRSLRLCADGASARTFRECRRPGAERPPVELRIRGIPVPLLCRPGTSDADVLWDTYGEAYHRPRLPLPSDATILDLGANVGYTAVDFAVRHPGARIVAVELDGDNATLAERNLAPFGERCTVVRAAVWSSDGRVTYGGNEAWGLRVVPGPTAADSAGQERTAPAIRIQTILRRFGLDRVDYVKMDIEGGEAEVLSDAGWMDRVDGIKVEVHPPATVESCEEVLRAAGFEVSLDSRHVACVEGWRRAR